MTVTVALAAVEAVKVEVLKAKETQDPQETTTGTGKHSQSRPL